MNELLNNFNDELENKLIELLTKKYNINRKIVWQLIKITKNDTNIIKDSYELLFQKNDVIRDGLKVKIEENNKATLTINDVEIYLTINDILRIFIYLIDLFTPTYPLGTIVSLKKQYLGKLLNNKEIDKAYFVITKRFIYNEKSSVYFNYAGVPYPVGNLGIRNDFYFTDNLIDKVIYKGFDDNQDAVFVYMMKRELIIEKNYKSVGYATKEERDKLMKNNEGI